MKRPWSSRLSSARSSHGSPAAALRQSASAATQFAARIATSIVHAQFGPSSTGLAAIQLVELGAELVQVARVAGQPVRGREQREVLDARELPRAP